MAQLSLGESRWRMIRRVVKKKKFKYDDCRNQTRHDQLHFEWLVENGFIVLTGDESYELSEKGKLAADLGFYEWEPSKQPKPQGKEKKAR